jgi:hypothetical protein
MAGEEVVKAGCLLLEALRSGRVGIVRDERGEVVDLLVQVRGLRGTMANGPRPLKNHRGRTAPLPYFIFYDRTQVDAQRVVESPKQLNRVHKPSRRSLIYVTI